jgi:transcriptional regulator with GAF, ATPase, and Fis domain
MKRDRQLIAAAKAGASLSDAATSLGTSTEQIQQMARRLGLRQYRLPVAGLKVKAK